MPELPEVQTIVDDLKAAGLIGRSIVKSTVHWAPTIAGHSAADFRRRIKGQTVREIYRRAKYIIFLFAGGTGLAVHLRMTGRFQLSQGHQERCKHVHVILSFDDGRDLCFHDTRKFGRFFLVDDPGSFLSALGPEPLSPGFTTRELGLRLAGKHRHLKPLLLDQHFVAGLGNIYVDEALWTARLHPLRRADALTPDQIRKLHGAIRHVLRQGLKNAGTTLGRGQNNFYSLGQSRGRNGDQLKVFRRTGEPCPRCGRPIIRIIVAQRSTHICEHCQQ